MPLPVSFARAAGFFGILAIILLSLVPGSHRPHTGLPGGAEHFAAYCLTAFFLALGFRPLAHRIGLAIGLSLLAASMEVLQHFVHGRHPAIHDALASSLGGFLGLALGSLLIGFAAQA